VNAGARPWPEPYVESGQELRLAELMAAMSLATDITMGQPMEDGLAVCLLATRVAEELGLPDPERERVFDTALLRHIGCTADMHVLAAMAGDDDVASADATATYVCVNRGGGNPSAQNKTTVAGPVSETGQFSSGKNGQVTASLTIDPPPSDISCPPGQSLELAQVSYTNVAITDVTNNVTEPIPGTFDSGCLLPNVRGACD
jgi:hypothetical protein